MNKLMYRFVAMRKKKKKRNRPVFRHGMPLLGIPRNYVCPMNLASLMVLAPMSLLSVCGRTPKLVIERSSLGTPDRSSGISFLEYACVMH